MLGAEAFYNEYIAPVLTEFISRRFEGICRDYFSLQVRAGKRRGVRNIGSYYYDDPVHRKTVSSMSFWNMLTDTKSTKPNTMHSL